MYRLNRSVAALAIISALLQGGGLSAAPTAKPPQTPIQAASAALLKEYHSIMKEKKGVGLREKSDYFTQNKVEGLTPEMILAALEKPIASDPRADAYVKWQLLSGIESRFPDVLKARALKVYRAAPVPHPHPGMDHAGFERVLNRTIGIMSKDKEIPVNAELAEKIKEYRETIEPILSYRDELYSRLPPGYDTLVAGFSDVYIRVSTGAPANEFWTTLSAATRSWGLTGTEPANMRQLAGAIGKLRTFIKDEKNKPYYRVIWTTEDKYTGLKWVSEATIQNDKAMEDVSTWLIERAQSPASGGLKFKDAEQGKK